MATLLSRVHGATPGMGSEVGGLEGAEGPSAGLTAHAAIEKSMLLHSLFNFLNYLLSLLILFIHFDFLQNFFPIYIINDFE